MSNLTTYQQTSPLRVIISGGGTGGHIFPAVAIANALRRANPDTEILFVGALGKMEMEMVPNAGYKIIGLEIQGLNRSSMLKNLALPFKMFKSLRKAMGIINDFHPDIAIGVGGYASGPMLLAAKLKGIPYLLQEQNSFAGLTNKWLGKGASKICVAFEGMNNFFPEDKIQITGNPIRKEVVQNLTNKRVEALRFFGLQEGKKTILLTGGSLGARTLNEAIMNHLQSLKEQGIQLIWQTGKLYYDKIATQYEAQCEPNIKILPFLDRMDLAYSVADMIIARAGAGTIAELCMVGKPVILVPSPNVAEDHQTKNAMALVNKNAALMVADAQAINDLIPQALALLNNALECETLSREIKKLGIDNADDRIVQEVVRIVRIK